MKNLLNATLFLSLLILLTACPYESTVPITESDQKIDDRLLGKWYKEGEMNNEYPEEYYEIKALGDRLLEVNKYERKQDSTYREYSYISHLSVLQGENGKKYHFLNMKKDGKYYLHRIDLQPGRFTLYEVTDNIDEKFNDSNALKNFVKQYMHLSFFYNKDEKEYFKGDHEK